MITVQKHSWTTMGRYGKSGFSGVDFGDCICGDDSGNGDTDGNVSYLVRTGQGWSTSWPITASLTWSSWDRKAAFEAKYPEAEIEILAQQVDTTRFS